MAHPIYSRQQLLNRGMIKVKKVASDLGVLPTGDKRLIQSWVDAIIQHQAAQVQEVELVEAIIDFDGDCYEGLTHPYVVVVGGKIVHRATTYQMAERHCKWQGYTLLDGQTLAQQELETELEVQATAAEKSATIEVLEQQHQLAVKDEIASRISFISPNDFGYHEAIANNDVHHVIGTIEYHSDRDCDQPWWNTKMAKKSKTLASYEEAEQFIKDEYVKGIFMERGSGRITQPIEDMGMTIEDSNFVHDFGQSYTVRIYGILAGSIFLDDDHGWTLNGKDYQDDWRPVAKELAKLTRRNLVAA